MIRKSTNIKGIKLNELDVLILLFADDTTLYLNGLEKSFKGGN